MKKRIALFLVAAMLLSMVGCAPQQPASSSSSTTAQPSDPKPSESKPIPTDPKPSESKPVPTDPKPTDHVHSYTEAVTAPTCTEGGYMTFTCACGDTYRDNEVAALGHSWGDWVTTLEPTEETEGQAERTCAACSEKESKTLPKLDHVHKYEEKVTAPTCTEKGYTTFTCVCGDTYRDNEVAALGHSYTEKVTAPTCTEKGYTTFTCACGHSYKGNEVAALGHSWGQWKVTTAHSCSTDEISSRSCSGCNATETEITKYAGHDYVDGACTMCGKTYSLGLEYEKWQGQEAYAVVGIGSCEDEQIIIPDTYEGLPVVAIKRYAFEYAYADKIVLPDSVTYIDSWAFYRSSITEFTIPAPVEHMYWNAFEGCYDLEAIYVQEGNQIFSAVDGVLYSKDGKTLVFYPNGKAGNSFAVPEGVEIIGFFGFYGNYGLRDITLPESLKEIQRSAFQSTGINQLRIPAATTSIDSSAFSGTFSLEKYIVDPANTALCDVDGIMFSKDMKTLLHFPAGVAMESYTVPATVTELAPYCFDSCGGVREVILQEGLKTIGEYAFLDGGSPMALAMGITSIYIPASVESIGENAFEECFLREFRVSPDNAVYKSENGMLLSKDGTQLLCFPGYIGWDSPEDKITVILPDTVTHIADYAMVGLSWVGASELEIVLPASLVSIGEGAFTGVPNMAYFSYQGTVAQWEAVAKGEDWHNGYPDTVLKCSDGEVVLS